jgi:plastocyanin
MHSLTSRRGRGGILFVALLLISAATAVAAGTAPSKAAVTITGGSTFKANEFVKDTVHYGPGTTTVRSGATITVNNRGAEPDPHTFSLVKKSDVPRTSHQAFNCKICEAITRAHGVDPNGPPPKGPPPIPLVNVGAPGFDVPGDSIFIGPKGHGGKVSFKVSAKKGTTLYFICIIHPWMQGKLVVK